MTVAELRRSAYAALAQLWELYAMSPRAAHRFAAAVLGMGGRLDVFALSAEQCEALIARIKRALPWRRE